MGVGGTAVPGSAVSARLMLTGGGPRSSAPVSSSSSADIVGSPVRSLYARCRRRREIASAMFPSMTYKCRALFDPEPVDSASSALGIGTGFNP